VTTVKEFKETYGFTDVRFSNYLRTHFYFEGNCDGQRLVVKVRPLDNQEIDTFPVRLSELPGVVYGVLQDSNYEILVETGHEYQASQAS